MLASAGHLAPYLNGAELPVAGSLPLGLESSAAYEQASFTMRPSDRLLLLTDGVVEAQNERGELLGFEHVQTLVRANTPARTLADTAQQHGQAECQREEDGLAAQKRHQIPTSRPGDAMLSDEMLRRFIISWSVVGLTWSSSAARFCTPPEA